MALMSSLDWIRRLGMETHALFHISMPDNSGDMTQEVSAWIFELEHLGVIEQIFDVPGWLSHSEKGSIRLLSFKRTDRTSVVQGKRVSVRVDLGVCRIITKK